MALGLGPLDTPLDASAALPKTLFRDRCGRLRRRPLRLALRGHFSGEPAECALIIKKQCGKESRSDFVGYSSFGKYEVSVLLALHDNIKDPVRFFSAEIVS